MCKKKFKLGDMVKVIDHGWAVDDLRGRVGKIVGVDHYGSTGKYCVEFPGWKNGHNGWTGTIGEDGNTLAYKSGAHKTCNRYNLGTKVEDILVLVEKQLEFDFGEKNG